VRRDAADGRRVCPLRVPGANGKRRGGEARDGDPQPAMLLSQQRQVLPPQARVRTWRDGKPVASGTWETRVDVARQTAPHDVLPVGGVEYDFPDVVAAAARTPH